MKESKEYLAFNDAMHSVLRANHAQVKAAVDAEIQAHTAEREARGENRRGRKPKVTPSTSVPASDAKD